MYKVLKTFLIDAILCTDIYTTTLKANKELRRFISTMNNYTICIINEVF